MSDEKPAIANAVLFSDAFERKVPDGDNRERLVCRSCDYVHYQNPKIVVGTIVEDAGKILMVKRAIEPRYGFWTLPAGYLEENETAEHGAAREAQEEAMAEVKIDRLFAVYSIPRISQIQLMYTASLAEGAVPAPGEESLDVALFDWDDIPWDELAFPSVYWALKQYESVRDEPHFAPFTNPKATWGISSPSVSHN